MMVNSVKDMDNGINLVKDNSNEKLSYFTRGTGTIINDNYSLLGFKDNMAVVTGHCDPSKLKGTIKILKKFPTNLNFTKVQTDDTGEKFINLNGQKLKVVPQCRIPEDVRMQTLVLKQHITTGGGLKNPRQIRLISSTAINNSDTLTQLVKSQSSDKLVSANRDKTIPTIPVMKKIKLITSNSQKAIHSSSLFIQNENSTVSTQVDPTIVLQGNKRGGNLIPAQPLLPVVYRRENKLLCEKTINILNQVKMQALNLSKKRIEQYITCPPLVVDVGVQTEESEKKFTNQIIQTDLQSDVNKPFDLLDFITFESAMDGGVGESPLLSDVNLGTGPTIGKVLIPSQLNSVGVGTNNMGYCVNGKQASAYSTSKKQLLFFKDLRECLMYNALGNLPLHEGVIKNDVGLVKRHCTALEARKAGVNMENHNGCTPLQLAVIHDAHVDIVQTLLDAGADIQDSDGEGNSILHLGARFQRYNILKVIVFHRTFKTFAGCLNNFNFDGLTPLMICCIASWSEGANLFIKHGADVNLKDQTSGRTALFHAAEAQNVEIVRTLLTNHADPKIKNFFGTSPHDAMYELDDMDDIIKGLIFGKSKKRSMIEEMNPVRTAKAAKNLKTFSRLQKIEPKGVPFGGAAIRYKMQRQIK